MALGRINKSVLDDALYLMTEILWRGSADISALANVQIQLQVQI